MTQKTKGGKMNKTNKLITEYSLSDLGTPRGWVYNQGHFLMFDKKEYNYIKKTINEGGETFIDSKRVGVKKSENFVYDIESKKLIQQFNGITPNPRKWGQWIGYGNFVVTMPVQQNTSQSSNTQNKVIIQTLPTIDITK